MSVESPSLFAQAIQEHLELKQRNADLDHEMPLDVYKSEDPFENHPLFKTEEQARLEETMDGTEPAVAAHSWPGEETATVENTAPVASPSQARGSPLGRAAPGLDW